MYSARWNYVSYSPLCGGIGWFDHGLSVEFPSGHTLEAGSFLTHTRTPELCYHHLGCQCETSCDYQIQLEVDTGSRILRTSSPVFTIHYDPDTCPLQCEDPLLY